jgi:hypothetical protein
VAKITSKQWLMIERRHLVDGESVNALAQAFGVNESSIRRKIRPKKAELPEGVKSLTELANEKFQIAWLAKKNAEQIALLPYERRTIVEDLARKLICVIDHSLSAAEYGAMTAHRLNEIAFNQVDKVHEANPNDDGSIKALRSIDHLSQVANKQLKPALYLLNANKEALTAHNGQNTERSLSELTDDEILDRLSEIEQL